MRREVTETPEKWVILKIKDNLYKIFATWGGSYLGGESWKLNSGIKTVEKDENFYYFTGFSGSCYKCHKKSYGVIGSYGNSMLDKILREGVVLMEDSLDWSELIK